MLLREVLPSAYLIVACTFVLANTSPAQTASPAFTPSASSTLPPVGPVAFPNAPILETDQYNPTFDTSDPKWAKNLCGGNTFLSASTPKFEWTPVFDPTSATESAIVRVAGVALTSGDSTEDLWFTHPFGATMDPSKGADYNIDVAWSSNASYDRLVAPPQTNDADTNTRNALAQKSGLPNPIAIHVEADSQFIPPAYRANVGDSVVVFGRWIVDCGHNVFQSEIHPPLLFVRAGLGTDNNSTTSTVIGRPFLDAQTFGGDGLYSYLINEVGKEAAKSLAPPFPGALIIGDHLTAESSVLTTPFQSLQWMIYRVRPPYPQRANNLLYVSYHFVVRSGVTVTMYNGNDGKGTILVSVLFDATKYVPATLPEKQSWNVPLGNIKADDNLGPYIDSAQFGAAFITANPAMAALLQKGVMTAYYSIPAIQELPNKTVLASTLSPTAVLGTVDNSQPFPVAGSVIVRWVTPKPAR